jgi:hypothetical protein
VFAHDTFTSIFGTPRPGETEVLPGLIRAALREGYAVVLNEPGTKKPLCTLTTAARRKADRDTYEADLAAGVDRPRTSHPCGIYHALTAEDTGKVTKLVERLTTVYGAPPNIGLEPRASHMVVVDVDTAGQRDAFLSAWAAEQGSGETPSYTVASPGARRLETDGSETWMHRDGGHYWFTLPAGTELPISPDGRGVLTAEEGWSLIWAGLQVLVPPSVRSEGPYRLVGSPLPAPRFLLDRIEADVVLRAERERLRLERRAERTAAGDTDPVDAWAAETPWAALLEPRGWHATGRPDTCGCPTWTAPGPHGSPKSATAHDLGCTRFDSDDGHAPLHVWTDNPPDYLAAAVKAGQRTVTKLTHEACADHEGSESAAVVALGLAVASDADIAAANQLELDEFRTAITPEPSNNEKITSAGNASDYAEPGIYESVSVTTLRALDSGIEKPPTGERASDDDAAPSLPVGGADTLADGTGPENTDSDEPDTDTPGPWFDWTELSLIPPPEPMIAGVLDHRTMTVLAGKFGTYKTFLALDWAASLATGTPWAGHATGEAVPVVYVAAEGVGSFDRRLMAWQHGHGGLERAQGMLSIHHGPVDITKNEAMSGLVGRINATGARLVIIDTLSRCAPGLEENEAAKMAGALERLFILRDVLGVAVLVLHHTGHQGLRARGSSVLEDNADASWVIRLNGDGNTEDRGPEIPRTLVHRKSKDGELLGDRPMTLMPVEHERGGSAYLSFDAFDAPTAASRRDAEREGLIEERVTILKEREQDHSKGRLGVREAERVLGGNKSLAGMARARYLDRFWGVPRTPSDGVSPSDHEGDGGHPGDGDTENNV